MTLVSATHASLSLRAFMMRAHMANRIIGRCLGLGHPPPLGIPLEGGGGGFNGQMAMTYVSGIPRGNPKPPFLSDQHRKWSTVKKAGESATFALLRPLSARQR